MDVGQYLRQRVTVYHRIVACAVLCCKVSTTMRLCFVKVALLRGKQRNAVIGRCSPRRGRQCNMKLTATGRASLFGGIGILTALLTNRLVFTPLDSLALTQSRSDILGVIAGTTLLLYGVGKAEIADRKKAVELSGVDVRQGFGGGDAVSDEVEWGATALLEAIPNVRSCAVLIDGVGRHFLGRFRDEEVSASIVPDGVVDRALQKGQRAYLADMKTVPVKEVEFGYLPDNCQVCSKHRSDLQRFLQR